MQNLQKEFERKKRLYLRKKRQHSKKSEREREQKIKRFLTFCEKQGIRRIGDVKQKHYDMFMHQLSVNVSAETKRKYAYALREFTKRAHLNIKINPARATNRIKTRKLAKILEILSITEATDKQKQEILKIL